MSAPVTSSEYVTASPASPGVIVPLVATANTETNRMATAERNSDLNWRGKIIQNRIRKGV